MGCGESIDTSLRDFLCSNYPIESFSGSCPCDNLLACRLWSVAKNSTKSLSVLYGSYHLARSAAVDAIRQTSPDTSIADIKRSKVYQDACWWATRHLDRILARNLGLPEESLDAVKMMRTYPIVDIP